MESEHKSAFISYSWDSLEHQKWVYELMQHLRRKNIDVEIDITITQNHTINLNVMMVQNLRDRDFVIFVLTEKYAQKADALEGGVGFETKLSLDTLKTNPDKFIFIGRSQGDINKIFPFHLRGYHIIDFSDDRLYNEAFNKLVHRINKIPLFKLEPLSAVPAMNLGATIEKKYEREIKFADFQIPDLRGNTHSEKNYFIEQNYNEIILIFEKLLDEVKLKYPNFSTIIEKIIEQKRTFHLYLSGEYKTSIEIWINSQNKINNIHVCRCRFNKERLNNGQPFKYSSNVSAYSDSFSCGEDNDKKLLLRKGISNLKLHDNPTTRQIVKEIWESYALPFLHY